MSFSIPKPSARSEHGVCVVGSGFAGVAVATRLAEQGVDTVLLEAGGRTPQPVASEGSDERFPYAARGEAVFPFDWNRTIAIGGTSHRWSGVVSRFLPNDFRTASAFGLFADWPLGFDDLRADYDEAEALLSTQGASPRPGAEPPRDRRYGIEWPVEDDAFSRSGAYQDLAFFPLAFSSRHPAGRAGDPIRLHEIELPRFTALPAGTLRAECAAVRLCERDGAIEAVDVVRPDGEVERIAARSFVLAAGVLETVRLLRQSTSAAWPNGLGNRHDQLGRFVHAHPRHRSWVRRQGPWADLRAAYRSYAFCDALRREGLGSVCLDVNLLGPEAGIDLTQEAEPTAESRVLFDPTRTDRWGRPLAILEASPSTVDRRTARRIAALDAELCPLLLGTAERSAPSSVTWFHPAGGCRMGNDPEDAVVDRRGRVFGLENLYVAGAATFPTSGATNPTLTVVALALRLAEHLFASLGGDGI